MHVVTQHIQTAPKLNETIGKLLLGIDVDTSTVLIRPVLIRRQQVRRGTSDHRLRRDFRRRARTNPDANVEVGTVGRMETITIERNGDVLNVVDRSPAIAI